MPFLLYPSRERAVFQDGPPLLWQLEPYVALFSRPELGTTGALLARRMEEDGSEHGVVLIHQLPTSSSRMQESVDVFREEWKRATRLSHPNILRTLDVWLDTPGAHFQLVTEYVPGETLSTALAAQQEPMPVSVALAVASKVAHGLHAAHEATDSEGRPLEVLHRDVAPAHVWLGYDGQVKLSGFGIAATAVQRMGGAIFKHVGSQPPEAQRKGSGTVGRRADVYGLGVTLYEALTGVDPYRRPHDYDSLKAAMNADAPPPSQHRPGLSPMVDALVMRAMAPKAEDRYATAEEFARAMEALRTTLTPADAREEVAAYLRGLFDAERIAARTRVPTLEELRKRAAAAAALEAMPPEAEAEPGAAPEPTRATRFVPHSRLMVLYGGFLMLILSAVLTRVAKGRESFVAEVTEVAREGQGRAVSCLGQGASEPVPVQLTLDGQGRAEAKVAGPLAGTVAARCIEESLAVLPYPHKRGLPVTVEVAADTP